MNKPLYILALLGLCIFLAMTVRGQDEAENHPANEEQPSEQPTAEDEASFDEQIGLDEQVADTDDISLAAVESALAEGSATMQDTADEGIQIQVEGSTGISGAENEAGAIKVYSPWPAKPMTKAPEGWDYVPAPAQIEPYRQGVKLGGGNTLELSITPFVLVPKSDAVDVIRIAEPGYDPVHGFSQIHTVGAMLQKSTMAIEANEKNAAKAISLLQQLLASLPQQK